jgi:hypothetical protein
MGKKISGFTLPKAQQKRRLTQRLEEPGQDLPAFAFQYALQTSTLCRKQ